MSKFKEYLETMDKRKKIIGISAVGLVACVAIGIGTYSIISSKPTSNNEPVRELIVQQQSEKVNKYTGDKKDFHFNNYWTDRSGGIYTINESNNVTNVEYKKNMGNEWTYMATPVEGKFSDFKYINLKVTGDKGKKLFLKLEESAIELKAKFFTLNGKEQILTLDISDVKNKKKLDALKEVMLFASPGEVQDGSFKILDAWFSMESATVNRYTGDKKDFHFNKYWEDIFNHGIAIDEENETTIMTFTKPKDNNWVLASTAVEGKLSDFNYATIKLKGEAGQKFLLKLEKGDKVYGEKLVELSGEEEVVIVKLNKDDMEGLDSLKEVRVFPNAGEPESGKLDILDAWFSVEKPEGFKEAGEATPSGANSEYINGWKIEEWTKYVGENVNGLTKVTYNNPAEWAYVTYNVEGKISGNNLLNLYLNSNGCDHVMIKLRGKFKYVDPVGGYNVYDEVEVFSDKIKPGETNVQVDITEAVRELGHVVDVVMFVESSQNVKNVDRVGSLIFGAPKFTEGQAIGNSTTSSKWIVDDWTGYTAEIKDGFTRISYDKVEPWANISYNIKNLLKDNNVLELKLNSNGCEHVQVKLRGKYLNSDPGYKVYQEALVFDGKLNNGEKILKIDLKEAIKELGRENITDIIMFIESNQLVEGLDRKGSLDIYTPVFSKAAQTTPTPEVPGDKNSVINSTFDNSLGDWEVFTQVNSGDATGEIKDGAVVIDVNKIGSENWHVQFVNKKLKLEKGATYKYSVKLKSTVNRPVEIVIQEDGGSYKGFSSKIENATNEYQTFTNEFKYDGEATTNLAFLINLGKVEGITNLDKHTVYVDEIKLVKVSDGNTEEKPEEPIEVIQGIKKYELSIPADKLAEIGGKITDVILFVESDGTIEDVDRSGEIEILETALLNKEGKKFRINEWTTDTDWNQYSITKTDSKTTVKYNNVAEWATLWGKVNDDNNYNDKISIIFNTSGCDHLIVKVKGPNGEFELGKDYVKNMPSSEVPVQPEVDINNTINFNIDKSLIEKLGGKVDKVLIFVESNSYAGAFDKSGKLEIVEATLKNDLGESIDINNWKTDIGWNQYQISNEGSKVIVEYNNVQDWAHIISDNIAYKDNFNNLELKLNSIGCDHITVKIVGVNGVEEEVMNTKLIN